MLNDIIKRLEKALLNRNVLLVLLNLGNVADNDSKSVIPAVQIVA